MLATIDAVAGVIGDPSRSTMLVALIAGRALTAGELSMIAGVSAQNASAHLRRLLDANLVAIEVQGRHRYYRLYSAEVGRAIEALAAISGSGPVVRSEARDLDQIRFCRSCYDHLAGRVAAAITQELMDGGSLLEDGRDFEVSGRGRKLFADIGIDVDALRTRRRTFARRCLDWTERRPHISGALGAAMLRRFVGNKWLVPVRGSRAMRLTVRGREALTHTFVSDAFKLALAEGRRVSSNNFRV